MTILEGTLIVVIILMFLSLWIYIIMKSPRVEHSKPIDKADEHTALIHYMNDDECQMEYDSDVNMIGNGMIKEVELTAEMRQTLFENIAYVWGSDTPKFLSKLKEFNFDLDNLYKYSDKI